MPNFGPCAWKRTNAQKDCHANIPAVEHRIFSKLAGVPDFGLRNHRFQPTQYPRRNGLTLGINMMQ
jgi:hypothetical protein